MTAPELLRAAGWRQGHNPDGSEYWEHDKFRLMRHSLVCALAQELDWEQDELAHYRPAIRALNEGQNELRRQLEEARKQALEVQRGAEQALDAERRAQAKELSRLARYDAVARKVRDNGLSFCDPKDRTLLLAMRKGAARGAAPLGEERAAPGVGEPRGCAGRARSARGGTVNWDIEWCEICDGHHGPGQHPTAAESAIATRNAELHTKLARVRAELAEANTRWHSACDVGRRLEVSNARLLTELAETRAKLVVDKLDAVRTRAERKVLDAAQAFLRDWEDSDAVPNAHEMPAERALYDAASEVRALEVDAELRRRGEIP